MLLAGVGEKTWTEGVLGKRVPEKVGGVCERGAGDKNDQSTLYRCMKLLKTKCSILKGCIG